jgi:hypothetical protein
MTEPIFQTSATREKDSRASRLLGTGITLLVGFLVLSVVMAASFGGALQGARQSEAIEMLEEIYNFQQVSFLKNQRYLEHFEAGRAAALKGQYYTCFLSQTPEAAAVLKNLTLKAEWAPGVRGACPACDFSALCVSTVPVLDAWAISSSAGECQNARIQPGVVCHVATLESGPTP